MSTTNKDEPSAPAKKQKDSNKQKQTNEATGGASKDGASRLTKEEKKRQKAERRVGLKHHIVCTLTSLYMYFCSRRKSQKPVKVVLGQVVM